ncbi:MAG: phage tail protein [Alphaproteobacteria bacterium]
MATDYEIICQGEQKIFLLPFVVYRAQDVKIYFNGILQSQNYAVSQLGIAAGAIITFSENVGVADDPITLKVTRQSDVSPWLRFNDFDKLSAAMLNNAQDHIYTIMEDNRNLSQVAGGAVTLLQNSENLLNESQTLQSQAQAAANQAIIAAQSATEAAQNIQDITDYNAAAIQVDNSELAPSVNNIQQCINWLASPYVSMPVGSLLIWFFHNPPQGYMQAKGQLLNRADYPELWALVVANNAAVSESEWINNKGCFAMGDGSTNFRLPDLSDMFLRAMGEDRNLGSYQGDAIRNISGSFASLGVGLFSTTANDGVFKAGSLITSANSQGFAGSERTRNLIFNAANSVPTANENRPQNIALNFCIKVKSHI